MSFILFQTGFHPVCDDQKLKKYICLYEMTDLISSQHSVSYSRTHSHTHTLIQSHKHTHTTLTIQVLKNIMLSLFGYMNIFECSFFLTIQKCMQDFYLIIHHTTNNF